MAALVAEGMSNRQITSSLGRSPRHRSSARHLTRAPARYPADGHRPASEPPFVARSAAGRSACTAPGPGGLRETRSCGTIP
ncbi:hypothetical protein ACSCB1_40545 [Streptomyces europaeiscabiei]|uniref:hypothetical protein n=1 Tax=Streptomyces europaeiscabiei TaxID=146819 RepID=UPI001FCFC6B5|nr:hypothetical protein [Streptomyces europaeiscabiei]